MRDGVWTIVERKAHAGLDITFFERVKAGETEHGGWPGLNWAREDFVETRLLHFALAFEPNHGLKG